ncbi:MAG: hypothetical protein K1X55_07080 [Chitinophagales bacterium]|nr:hypothetical protein [Chitinophagales bacterium]
MELNCQKPRYLQWNWKPKLPERLHICIGVILLLCLSTLNIQAQRLMDVSVNVTGMSWNYPCGDGTVILGSCVATSAPDPRMRYRIGYNGAGYTGPVIHKIDETTDAGSTSLSGLVYSNTEVCQGSISFEMQSWEEDQGCCPGAGFCPSDADDAYYDNAAGCLGTGDDNYSGIVNRSFNITGFSVGTFPVTYNLGDATVSFNVTLSYSPLPTPTVANPAPLGCPGNSTTLTVTSGLSQPGNNFVWMTSANDLTTAVETGSTFTTPPLAGTTTYYVAEQQGSCVGPSRAITINMTTPPAAPTATSPVSTCINGQAILTATSTVSNAQFNWYSVPVGGVAIWNGTSFTTPNIGATQAFYVSVTDPSTGCEGSRTQIIVNPDLTISAPTANDIDVCEGTSGTLTATGNGGAMNWYSDAALTNLLFVGNPYTTPTLTTNQTYYIVEDFNGCLSSTGSVDVNVNPKPEAPSNTFEYFCPSESVTLNALPSAPAGQTAQWFSSPNEAAYLNSGNSFEILSVYSRRTVYYRFVDDVTGCASDFATWDVYVYPEVEEPNADNLDLCINQSGVLNASAVSGDIVWYDQDGITELETDAGNIGQLNVGPFATTGTYTYYVQARDANCESGLIPVSVFVASGSPTSPPVATDDEICAGETATLTATGTVGGAMYWYADNALTDLLFIGSPYVTQSLSNTTSIWVAESAGGCGVSTATEVVVTVNTKPQAPDNTSDYFCPSEMVTLNASPSAPAGQTTQWFSSPDESSYLNSGNSFDIFSVYSRRTLYYRFVDDVTGCKSDFATWDVYVYPEVEEPNADNVDLCVNQSGVLNASAVSGDIIWYDQDGITELETDAGNIGQLNVGPFASSGVYTYYVQARDANCESGLVPVTVFVTSGSPVDPPMAMGDEICAGETATLVATGTVGGAMYWYADNTLTDLLFIGSPYITQSLTANTSFWVAESAGDCGVSTPTEVEVTVNPKPATPTADPQTICAGERAVLTAEGSGGDIYWYSDPLGVDLWNIGDEFTTPPLAQYTPYYIIEEDPATGCRSDVGVTWVNVDNFTYVSSATVTKNPICEGETTTIKVATTDIFSCVQLLDWNFDVVDEICLPDGDITGNGAWVADFEVGPFDESGDYIYYIQESDGFLFCPSQQFALVVSVVESPATPVVSDEEICEGASVTLVADDNGDGEIVWYADAGLSTELFIGNEYTVSPTTDLTVWVTRRNGSCTSASDAVTENQQPRQPTQKRYVLESVLH